MSDVVDTLCILKLICHHCWCFARNLKLEYLDLYLIHMPLRLSLSPGQQLMSLEHHAAHRLDIKSVWEAMEECQKLGLTKAIGVSNFSCKKLAELLSSATIPPAVNQVRLPSLNISNDQCMYQNLCTILLKVEMNPIWHQKQLLNFCKQKGIHITAYSPLGASGTSWGDGRVLQNDTLQAIAKARDKSVAQVPSNYSCYHICP